MAYFSKGGLGGGDIKMMAMVGSFSGPIVAVTAIFFRGCTWTAGKFARNYIREFKDEKPIAFWAVSGYGFNDIVVLGRTGF